MKTSTVTPNFDYVFNISLTCNNKPSFIGNLGQVLLLGNHLNLAPCLSFAGPFLDQRDQFCLSVVKTVVREMVCNTRSKPELSSFPLWQTYLFMHNFSRHQIFLYAWCISSGNLSWGKSNKTLVVDWCSSLLHKHNAFWSTLFFQARIKAKPIHQTNFVPKNGLRPVSNVLLGNVKLKTTN